MKKNAVVVIGCLQETLDTINYLYYLSGKVDAAVTITKKQASSLNITNWVDLGVFCRKKNIPLYYVKCYSMKTNKDLKMIKILNPQVIFVVGWQRLIPEKIIRIPEAGCIGFHGSANFLPWGRGRSPINWSIIEGRNRFILHMFFIRPGVDDGEIIGFEVYDITSEDTCRSVYYKTAMAQAKLIHRFLPSIRSKSCPRYPQMGKIYYYLKRTPEDGKINWNNSTRDICRLVRAVTFPYPGAFSVLKNKKVFIWQCQDFGNSLITSDAKPGEVIFVSSNKRNEFVVKCKDGSILVTEYTSPRNIKIGDKFEF